MTRGEGGRVVRLEPPGLVGRAAAIGGVLYKLFPGGTPNCYDAWVSVLARGVWRVVRLNNKVQWFVIVFSLLIGIQATQ